MLKADGKKIISKVRVASPLGKFLGLMFKRKSKFNYALIFEFITEGTVTSSLHMLFVFFPTDVLFLDGNKKVVDKMTMYPFRLHYSPKKPAKFAVELPKGKARGVKVGAKIFW